jgi:hypothetical protein
VESYWRLFLFIMCAGDYQIDDGDQKGAKQHELIKRDKSHLHHLPSTGRQKRNFVLPVTGKQPPPR